MGAETGATTSMFPYTDSMGAYLAATGRADIASSASAWRHILEADQGAEYDRVINIDLSTLEPSINGPATPDLATPLSKFKELIAQGGSQNKVSAGLIGSCTNSSFEDISRVAHLAKQALNAGLKPQAPLYLSPGSEATRATLEKAGVLDVFDQAGTTVLANACGPCCGSWNRQDVPKVRRDTITAQSPRNRNDELILGTIGHGKLHRYIVQSQLHRKTRQQPCHEDLSGVSRNRDRKNICWHPRFQSRHGYY